MGIRRRSRARGAVAAASRSPRSTVSVVAPDDAAALGAAGALLRYLGELQPAGLPHLARPFVRRADAFLWLDDMTRRNLELVEPLRAGARGCTLLETIDATVTPMGSRLLRQWLLSPLRDPAAIDARLDAVEVAVKDGRGRARLREALDGVRDIERLAGRAAAGRATPREMGALRDSFHRLPDVAEALNGLRASSGARGGGGGAGSPGRPEQRAGPGTRDATAPDPRRWRRHLHGYDRELDELRSLRDGGRQYIASLQQRERERTGIPSLKVGFNKVFGYYLEITNAHAAKVPADYERRQTLAAAERYVTPELKDYESRVLGAEERMTVREAELFAALRAASGKGHRAGAADRAGARATRRVDLACRAGGDAWLRAPASARRVRPGAAREPASRHRVHDAARVVHSQRRAVHRGGAGARW